MNLLDDTMLMIGVCYACGNQFLDGVCIGPYPRSCCTPRNTHQHTIEAANDAVLIIRNTAKKIITTSPRPDDLCKQCGIDPYKHQIFDRPFDENEKLCDNCLARYNYDLVEVIVDSGSLPA